MSGRAVPRATWVWSHPGGGNTAHATRGGRRTRPSALDHGSTASVCAWVRVVGVVGRTPAPGGETRRGGPGRGERRRAVRGRRRRAQTRSTGGRGGAGSGRPTTRVGRRRRHRLDCSRRPRRRSSLPSTERKDVLGGVEHGERVGERYGETELGRRRADVTSGVTRPSVEEAAKARVSTSTGRWCRPRRARAAARNAPATCSAVFARCISRISRDADAGEVARGDGMSPRAAVLARRAARCARSGNALINGY